MFDKRRVEEDLERIRRANLPPEVREAEDEENRKAMEAFRDSENRLTAKDIFAMIIAVLSLILPYAIIIFGIMVLVIFMFVR